MVSQNEGFCFLVMASDNKQRCQTFFFLYTFVLYTGTSNHATSLTLKLLGECRPPVECFVTVQPEPNLVCHSKSRLYKSLDRNASVKAWPAPIGTFVRSECHFPILPISLLTYSMSVLFTLLFFSLETEHTSPSPPPSPA